LKPESTVKQASIKPVDLPYSGQIIPESPKFARRFRVGEPTPPYLAKIDGGLMQNLIFGISQVSLRNTDVCHVIEVRTPVRLLGLSKRWNTNGPLPSYAWDPAIEKDPELPDTMPLEARLPSPQSRIAVKAVEESEMMASVTVAIGPLTCAARVAVKGRPFATS
jgi:hypothetical protein